MHTIIVAFAAGTLKLGYLRLLYIVGNRISGVGRVRLSLSLSVSPTGTLPMEQKNGTLARMIIKRST